VDAPENEGKEKMRWELALPQPAAAVAAVEAATKAAAPAMDADGFAGFYERSARALWVYLARSSADPALAEDLAQESYVRFLSSDRLAEVAAEGEVAARRYLFRIASNLLRDHWRRPRTSSLEDAPEECFSASGSEAASDVQMLLGPALGLLRPRDRQLLWLAYAEGCSHREIAEIAGLAGASVRLLLFRARRRMIKLLDETGNGGEGQNRGRA
jgi:RNA polymerase sigma-70 factor (ECF subfamily)